MDLALCAIVWLSGISEAVNSSPLILNPISSKRALISISNRMKFFPTVECSSVDVFSVVVHFELRTFSVKMILQAFRADNVFGIYSSSALTLYLRFLFLWIHTHMHTSFHTTQHTHSTPLPLYTEDTFALLYLLCSCSPFSLFFSFLIRNLILSRRIF